MLSRISRSGDLLAQMYLYAEIDRIIYTEQDVYDPTQNSYAYYTNALGHALISEKNVTIGGTEFCKMTGEFLELFETLTAPPAKLNSELTGTFSSVMGQVYASQNVQYLYVPFKFWFNRFYEQALPLIALYWHEVEINIQTRPLSELYSVKGNAVGNVSVPAQPLDMQLLCNFVYLDRPERSMFANGQHEYVFDQVQYFGSDSHSANQTSAAINIRYNHPVKELVWVAQRDAHTSDNDWFNYDGMPIGSPEQHPSDPILRAKIVINNHDRTINHRAIYYRQVQPLERHSRLPGRYVYCYSFALHPEALFASGSANFSRYDNATLNLEFPVGTMSFPDHPTQPTQQVGWDGRVQAYSINHQVGKFAVGMAGIRFAA